MMIYTFITLYLIFLLIKVFQKSDITLVQNTIFRDLNIDNSEHFFNESSPKLAFKWTSFDLGDMPIPIGYFNMYQFYKFMYPNNTYDNSINYNTVPMWNPELFPLGSLTMDFYKSNYYNITLNYYRKSLCRNPLNDRKFHNFQKGGYDKSYKIFISDENLFVCIIIYFNKKIHF